MKDDSRDPPKPQLPEARQPSSPARRAARVLVFFGVVPYLAITVLFTLAQRRLIYVPTQSGRLSVAAAGLDSAEARDVTLTTEDGLTLHGWLLHADPVAGPDALTLDDGDRPPTPLVLYFPGNAANRAARINDLRDFTRLGCDVLIFDYRGYAENPGSPSEATMTADARATWRFAVDELDVDPANILLFGESMGGAVAVSLAAHLCEQETPPAALITNATFDSLPSLAAHHYPAFPFRWLVWDRWPSIDRIAHVTCPVLMFQGSEDTIVPLTCGQRLFAAAPACSASGCAKCFVEIPGAGHNDIPVGGLREEIRSLICRVAL